MSRVLVEDHQVVSQTSRISWSRVTTRPASRTRTRSRSNSFAVSWSSSSPIQARCDSTSMRTPWVAGGCCGLGGAAPQQGPDPGEQFGEPEGLGDVVVGAGVEADDGVHLVGARGQDEDRHGVALGAQPAGDLQAVHAGQPQVEDDQVDAALQSGVERGGAVLAHLDLVTLPAQGAGQRLRDGRVVLGEQYTGHGVMVVRRGRRLGVIASGHALSGSYLWMRCDVRHLRMSAAVP